MLRVNIFIFHHFTLFYFLELLKFLIGLFHIMHSRHTIGKLSLICFLLFFLNFFKKLICFFILGIDILIKKICVHVHATLWINIITTSSCISLLVPFWNRTLPSINFKCRLRLSVWYSCICKKTTIISFDCDPFFMLLWLQLFLFIFMLVKVINWIIKSF